MVERSLKSIRWCTALIRARLWWDSKLPFALGVAYSLAWQRQLPLQKLWHPLLLLLIAGITSAIYASIFNDLLDEREDRIAGKVTPMMTLGWSGKAWLLVGTLAAMVLATALLFPYRAAFTIYLVVWVNYTLYSLPPFRLKSRGVWGVLCVALSEHLLAGLLAVSLITAETGERPSAPWVIAVVLWTITFGFRSILWHQLEDAQNDRISGTQTLGAKYDPAFLRRLGTWYVFPIEVSAFGVLLICSGSPIAYILFVYYVLMEWLRFRYIAIPIIIVAPQTNFRFAMLEYYQLFFPVAFLMEYARRDPNAVWLLIAQLLLFPAPVWLLLSHIVHLLRSQVYPFLASHYKRLRTNNSA